MVAVVRPPAGVWLHLLVVWTWLRGATTHTTTHCLPQHKRGAHTTQTCTRAALEVGWAQGQGLQSRAALRLSCYCSLYFLCLTVLPKRHGMYGPCVIRASRVKQVCACTVRRCEQERALPP